MIAKTLKIGLLVVAVFGLALVGCDKLSGPGVPDVVQTPDPEPVTASAYPIVEPLKIDATTQVGNITIEFTWDNVYVTFRTDPANDWEMSKTRLHIATNLNDIPHNNNGMLPNAFDYKVSHNPWVKTYMYTIPMKPEWRESRILYLSAYATLRQGSTSCEQPSWGGTNPYPGRNWGMYIRFCLPKLCKLPTVPVEVKLGQVYGSIPKTMWLRGVPSGYYVWNGEWPSFCLQTGTYIYGGRWYTATLIPSTLPKLLLPNVIRYGIDNSETPYDKINYLLNTYHDVHHVDMQVLVDLQNVIWHWRGYPVTLTPTQLAYEADADLHAGYYPPPCGYMAVFLWIGNEVQLTFIEVDP